MKQVPQITEEEAAALVKDGDQKRSIEKDQTTVQSGAEEETADNHNHNAHCSGGGNGIDLLHRKRVEG